MDEKTSFVAMPPCKSEIEVEVKVKTFSLKIVLINLK